MILYSVTCGGGCKSFFEADDPNKLVKMAEEAGWSSLEITGRYRCGACGRELARIATLEGAPARNDVDKLPKDSIGALKKLPERPQLHEKPRSD